jgi:hypothetical protein
MIDAQPRPELRLLAAPGSGGIGRDVAQGRFDKRFASPAPGRAEMLGAPVEKVRDVSPGRKRQPDPEHYAPARCRRVAPSAARYEPRSSSPTSSNSPRSSAASPTRKASLRRSSLSASSALALLEEAQPLADDLACVLVPPRRDAAFDEVVEVIRQVDFAGRHARLWNSAQERETGKNRQRKAWFNYIGHGKRSCPSIAWKLRVSAAGALSRTGRRARRLRRS